MYISKKWLQEYVTLPKKITPEELGEKITLASVEVEEVIDQAAQLQGVIVAEIKEVLPHPNADKLQVARVFDGKQELRIVCGAPNIAVGQKVPLATIGTYLPAMGFTIEERAVRGEVSQGMLCAPDELGLGSDHAGILILDGGAKVGQSLSQHLHLDDWIIEIDNKSLTNRPDMWGHYGIAREVAAIFNTTHKLYTPKKITVAKKETLPLKVNVQADKECVRYTGHVITGVRVTKSPEWIRRRLEAIGQQSINNVVDAANYVMFEFGQPLHAFDYDRITKGAVTVRKAKAEEKVTTLDGTEIALTTHDLVIADSQKPLALAGIKGLDTSGVQEATTRVLLEVAIFDHITIRKTSERLGLRTDASVRFEKSLDPYGIEMAVSRFLEILSETCPGLTVVAQHTDTRYRAQKIKPITTTVEYLSKAIGVKLTKKEVVDILTRLGFEVKGAGDTLSLVVPTWRATRDIEGEHDIVEEVARMYGYGNIIPQLPYVQIKRPYVDYEKMLIEKTRDIMAYGFDASEVYSYSFRGEKDVQEFGEKQESFVRVVNPVATGSELLRRDLAPTLVRQVALNAREYDQINLFEIGKVFRKEDQGEQLVQGSKEYLPKQDTHMAFVVSSKGDATPYFTAKNVIEALLQRLHCKVKIAIQKEALPWLHGQRSRAVMVGDVVVGYVGEIAQSVQKKLKIKERVGVCEINLSILASLYSDARLYTPLPKFPSIEMDVSMIVDSQLLWETVVDTIKDLNKEWVRNIVLFDVYEGEAIPRGKKSVAFRITYRSDDKTLETGEVDVLHNEIKQALEKEVGAEIRKG